VQRQVWPIDFHFIRASERRTRFGGREDGRLFVTPDVSVAGARGPPFSFPLSLPGEPR
jgi:hypothetical protein